MPGSSTACLFSYHRAVAKAGSAELCKFELFRFSGLCSGIQDACGVSIPRIFFRLFSVSGRLELLCNTQFGIAFLVEVLWSRHQMTAWRPSWGKASALSRQIFCIYPQTTKSTLQWTDMIDISWTLFCSTARAGFLGTEVSESPVEAKWWGLSKEQTFQPGSADELRREGAECHQFALGSARKSKRSKGSLNGFENVLRTL